MPYTSVTRRYHFESAHRLPKVKASHKCFRMHGHNYEIEVTIRDTIRADGFILDFAELDELVNPIIAEVDHRTLNDIKGLENPTAELIAQWFCKRINAAGEYDVFSVRCYETKDCWAEYQGQRADP